MTIYFFFWTVNKKDPVVMEKHCFSWQIYGQIKEKGMAKAIVVILGPASMQTLPL